jgi:hypothetical protein
MSLRTALMRARVAFDRDQRIPMDVAEHLMNWGIIVSKLEDQWSRG